MPETEPGPLNAIGAVYAFVPSMSDAHAVASQVVRLLGINTTVGFNESDRGEGYVMVDPAVDISNIVKQVTGSDPIRVVSWSEILDEPDGFGVPQDF